MVKVVITAPCAMRGGARYNPGEHAAFEPAVAQQLLSLGVARLAELPKTEEERPMPTAKALEGPLWDKMLKQAPVKKGGRP